MNIILKRFFPVFIVIVFNALVLNSCGGNKSQDENKSDTSVLNDTNITHEAFFQVPLPGDLFLQLKEYGVKAKSNLLNPVENVNKYTDQKTKAINFGVYNGSDNANEFEFSCDNSLNLSVEITLPAAEGSEKSIYGCVGFLLQSRKNLQTGFK